MKESIDQEVWGILASHIWSCSNDVLNSTELWNITDRVDRSHLKKVTNMGLSSFRDSCFFITSKGENMDPQKGLSKTMALDDLQICAELPRSASAAVMAPLQGGILHGRKDERANEHSPSAPLSHSIKYNDVRITTVIHSTNRSVFETLFKCRPQLHHSTH